MFTFKKKFNTIFFSSIGGILEYYDFVIFIILAKSIADNFFTGPEYLKLFATYGIFAAGGLCRPASGLILGNLGDKYGRKKIFLLSIIVMAFATLFVGFLPNYQTIGVLAPLLLVIARIVQGSAVGAEIPGAITFVYEHMPEGKKPLGVAIFLSSMAAGVLLASFILFILNLYFSEKTIDTWAWRIPFILGGFAGMIGFFMRLKLKETPEFLSLQKKHRILNTPFLKLIKNYKLPSITGLLIFISIGFVLIFFGDIIPSYIQGKLHYTNIQTVDLSLIFILTEVLMLPVIGLIINKPKLLTKRVFISSFIITAFFVLFTVKKFVMFSSWKLLVVYTIITSFATSVTYLLATLRTISFFPAKIRYSGVAATYNIGFGIAEASAPIIFLLAAHEIHTQLSPVYCFIVVFLVGIIAVTLISMQKSSRA